MNDEPLHLAVALDGLAHPPGTWVELVREAEAGLLDFVTIDDTFSPETGQNSQPDRLDAVQIAARLGPVTSGIGLVPTVTVTHTEPFHISKAIATLDYVSAGRAGLVVRVTDDPAEAAHFGRRTDYSDIEA
jgi:alkanesulfonate monooxygenase SsuD/methylene tetrahydromethanopterin reductase-like flavin-dependent oxidoreductase (luciferase family)